MRIALSVLTILVLACGPALADDAAVTGTTEVAIDPVSWASHLYNASASLAVSPHIVMRVDGGLHTSDEDAPQYWHAGSSTRLYLDQAFHGPFVEPGFDYRSYGALTFAQVLLGWQWTYASHYTMAASAGMQRLAAGSDVFGASPEAIMQVRVGYLW
jgi:hypothetical protein